jgi:hypothetical protein
MYKELNNDKIKVLKKSIKLFQNIMYILVLYIYMPEIVIHYLNDNDNDDNDKILFMFCFVVFSSIMSYILQNYQCKPPETLNESNMSYTLNHDAVPS